MLLILKVNQICCTCKEILKYNGIQQFSKIASTVHDQKGEAVMEIVLKNTEIIREISEQVHGIT